MRIRITPNTEYWNIICFLCVGCSIYIFQIKTYVKKCFFKSACFKRASLNIVLLFLNYQVLQWLLLLWIYCTSRTVLWRKHSAINIWFIGIWCASLAEVTLQNFRLLLLKKPLRYCDKLRQWNKQLLNITVR